MLKKNWFSYMEILRHRPWHLNISKHLCSRSFSEQQTEFEETEISKTKNWFLYFVTEENLSRLNISEICDRNSPKPQFEVVQDFYPEEGDEYLCRPSRIPIGMQHIIVDSKLYLVGGETVPVLGSSSDSETSDCDDYSTDDIDEGDIEIEDDGIFNLDVYTFDPSHPEGPSIRLCKEGGAVPRLIDPKFRNSFVVKTIEGKIYVLEETSFRVFDPLNQSWEHLPLPRDRLCFKDYAWCNNYCDWNRYYAWGHKLFISRQGFIFDTHKKTWEEEEEDRHKSLGLGFIPIAEFNSFLIGISINKDKDDHTNQLVAYRLDKNGIPKLYRVLLESQEILCPFFNPQEVFSGECDGGRMWLAFTKGYGSKCMRVVVFRVSMSSDLAGNPVLSANLEAAEYYELETSDFRRTSTTFTTYHHLNKHDTCKNHLFGTIIPHDHRMFEETKITKSLLPPENKSWFLYMWDYNGLVRLNISQFCEKSSPKPQFEIGDDSNIPFRMQHITVGSSLYLVGGRRRDLIKLGRWYYSDENLVDVYYFDPTGPSIRLCEGANVPIPRLIHHRTNKPIVFTLEEKIYVLATRPVDNYLMPPWTKSKKPKRPPFFKVFDPLYQSWKRLPYPPCFDKSVRDSTTIKSHFAFGHKLLIWTQWLKPRSARKYYDSYSDSDGENSETSLHIFDSREEKWEVAENNETLNDGFDALAQVVPGYLIGLPRSRRELVVYKLDSEGIPHPYQVMHELGGIFCPFLMMSNAFLGECDGGRMVFLHSERYRHQSHHYVRVAVFQVSMSNDIAGNPIFSADLQAAEYYRVDCGQIVSDYIPLAFVVCHHLNKHATEENKLFGTIVPHDNCPTLQRSPLNIMLKHADFTMLKPADFFSEKN